MIEVYQRGGLQDVLSSSQFQQVHEQSLQDFLPLIELLKDQPSERLLVCSRLLEKLPFQPIISAKTAEALGALNLPNEGLRILDALYGRFDGGSLPENHALLTSTYFSLVGLLPSLSTKVEALISWCRSRPNDYLRLATSANFLSQNIYGEQDLELLIVEWLPWILESILKLSSQYEDQVMAMAADLALAQKNYAGAISLLSRSIELGNDKSANVEKLAYLYLSDQQMEKGFQETLKRDLRGKSPLLFEQFKSLDRVSSIDELRQLDLVYVLFEQGIGDQLIYSQYLFDLLPLVLCQITIVCETRMVSIVKRMLKEVILKRNLVDLNYSVVSEIESIGSSVGKIWLADIPFLLKQKRPSGLEASFLSAAGFSDYAKAHAVVLNDSGFGSSRVGISWCGPGRKGGSRKDIPLSSWAPLLEAHPEIEFVSVQYGDERNAVDDFCRSAGLSIHVEDVDQILDLEAALDQLQTLDAVITTSSTVAHLAGSMGIPCAVLLPYVPLWYWEQQKNGQSLYYPSVHLIPRHQPNDLDSSIRQASDWLSFLSQESS